MKEFIYLDTDYITSALAQINNGKLINITEEVSDSTQNTQKDAEISNKNSANFGLGVPGILNAKVSNEKELKDAQSTLSTIESAKQILTKSFDDNIYDLLISELKNNNLISQKVEQGNYLYLTDSYKLIDINYILSLLTDDVISLYTSSVNVNNFNNLNRQQIRNDSVQKAVKAEKSKLKQQFKNIRDIVSVVKSISPTATFLSTDSMIAPLKNEFLRASYSEIDFKYKDNIHIFAQITRKFTKTDIADDINNLFFHAANSLLPLFFEAFDITLNDNTYIATPIAIYYE